MFLCDLSQLTQRCEIYKLLQIIKAGRLAFICDECNIYITESLRKLNTAKYLLYLMLHS